MTDGLGNKTVLEQLYETNSDFRRYVDRHTRQYEVSTEEALKHALVRSYAEYLEGSDDNEQRCFEGII